MKKLDTNLVNYFHPITGAKTDSNIIMHHIANAAVVLMGEATHGTHEFYKMRIELTKRLIREKRFKSIAIEGDFPDTYRVNRYINHRGNDKSAKEALADFKRFPNWMWRNEEMVSFIDWLHDYNKSQPEYDRVAIYGLDVYSLHSSIAQIIEILHKIDPRAAQLAQKRYACFDVYQNPQEYGYMASQLVNLSCRQQVIEQLLEIKKKKLDFFKYDNLNPQEERFYLEQNALIIKNAERYYRSLFDGDRSISWNVRDGHMMETIQDIEKYNKTMGKDYNLVVWAHNSHIGDARATQMSSYGELNVGQLAKEFYGPAAVSIGFTTYSGTVSAASGWREDVERKRVRPALEESMEAFFHTLAIPAFILIPSQAPELYEFFDHDDYLQRAIGVIYLPETERQSHYFYAQLSRQFDIVIHYDTTSAVKPLEITSQWHKGEDLPETFPSGL